jgi:hypothetical protein
VPECFNRSFALGDSTYQRNISRYKAINSAVKLNLYESYISRKAANLIFFEKRFFKIIVIQCIQVLSNKEPINFKQVSRKRQTQF